MVSARGGRRRRSRAGRPWSRRGGWRRSGTSSPSSSSSPGAPSPMICTQDRFRHVACEQELQGPSWQYSNPNPPLQSTEPQQPNPGRGCRAHALQISDRAHWLVSHILRYSGSPTIIPTNDGMTLCPRANICSLPHLPHGISPYVFGRFLTHSCVLLYINLS